jgi:hypothetical protein
MSKTQGDKARFHRLRKQRIARRTKVRELREKLAPTKITGSAPRKAKPTAI